MPFWRRIALAGQGAVVELGCGTGRISLPLVRAGAAVVGIDRSTQMLGRAASRRRRSRAGSRLQLVRADIRALPLASARFQTVIAPYGVLQSLTAERDLKATLQSVSRILVPGGRFGVDLVPDVASWREYQNRRQFHGHAAGGRHLTLVESVRQDRRRSLTIFDQRYIERRGRRKTEHRFTLTFRTLSIRQMVGRLARAGFTVDHILGDYGGKPWDPRADVWIILARKR